MVESAYPSTLPRHAELRRETAVEVRPAGLSPAAGYRPSAVDRTPSLREPLLRFVPWLIPATSGVLVLRSLDVPAGTIATYAAYTLLGVVLPGILLLRALCGSTGSWPEDIGLGAAIGLTYELAGWAIFTSTGQQGYLVAWPALVLVVFVTARPLHRFWRIGRPPRVPVRWHWGVALAVTVAFVFAGYYGLRQSAVPPAGVAYHPDLLYHLSMIQEAMRHVPPELPQVAGERLNYHWFANAHMAAASDITGIPPELVLMRMWYLPMTVVAMLIFAAMARQVTRVWWAGVLVAVLVASGQYVDVWNISASLGMSAMSYFSPSLQFGALLAAAAAILLIEQLYRGPSLMRTWFLIVPLLIAAGGAKPTGLPLLLGGIGLAGLFQLFQLFRGRRFPWRALAGAGLVAVIMWLTLETLVGSTAGSRMRLFGVLRGLSGYVEATGDRSMLAGPGWTLPALSDGDSVAYWGALVILATLLVSQLLSFAVFGALGHRGTRGDVVAWWLAGAVLAAWVAGLVVDHPSGGEIYFPRSAVPFATIGAVWLLASAVRGRSRRTRWILLGAGLTSGWLVVAAARQVRPSPYGSRENRIDALGTPVAVLAGSCLALMIVWLLLRWRVRPLRGLGAGVAALLVMGMTLPATWGYGTAAVSAGLPKVVLDRMAAQVHPDEQRAALWLRANSKPDDVVASNTACRPARRQPPCDARGYIVSGIAGRRAVLEGWAYTEQALAEHGVNGLSYRSQPSPWPDRAGIINRLFTSPTRDVVETLRTKFGVRWIYADQLAGHVAARTLGKLAVLRHEEPSVLIYELVDPGRAPVPAERPPTVK